MRKVPYPTSGEILLEEFLVPMDITQYRLAKEIGVQQRRGRLPHERNQTSKASATTLQPTIRLAPSRLASSGVIAAEQVLSRSFQPSERVIARVRTDRRSTVSRARPYRL
jgi:hypothetical protein